ncbi:MAG: hypothetical protein IPQ16_13470 [Geobacteraceae bacterium]|nr:hypothetical protein [Geobacteraceae bacterium]
MEQKAGILRNAREVLGGAGGKRRTEFSLEAVGGKDGLALSPRPMETKWS